MHARCANSRLKRAFHFLTIQDKALAVNEGGFSVRVETIPPGRVGEVGKKKGLSCYGWVGWT